MKKIQREYLDAYGDIPEHATARMEMVYRDAKLRGKDNIIDLMHEINTIGWKTHSFVIYVVPKGTPRPRSGANGVFYVKGAKDNHILFKEFAESVGGFEPIKTACKFECRSYLPIPHSMTKQERVLAELGFIRPISRPDWDNLGKAYCDMIQETLLEDDAQVIEGISKKYYSIKPRVEIDIQYMEDFDSKYNRRKKG